MKPCVYVKSRSIAMWTWASDSSKQFELLLAAWVGVFMEV